MQRGLVFGAGAVIVLLAGGLAVRSFTSQKAGAAVDQQIAQLLSSLPPGTRITHGTADYNPLTSTLTLHDLAVTQADGAAMNADTLTLSGGSADTASDMFDPSHYPGGRPAWTGRRPLIADAGLSNVRLTNPAQPGGAVLIRSVTLHRLSGRPFAMPPTPPNRADPAFQADVALALAFDTLAVTGLRTQATETRTAALSLGSFALNDYDGGTIGAASVKDLVIDAAGKGPRARPVHVSLNSLQAKTTDLRPLLHAILQSGKADPRAFNQVTCGAGDIGRLEMSVAHGPKISIASFHSEQIPPDAGGMKGNRANVSGLTLALGETPMPPTAAPALAAFGMQAITADIDGVNHSSADGRQRDLREDIVLHDLGTLHVRAAISGYDAALIQPGKPMAALAASTIDHAQLVWDDNSLTGRLLAVAAVQLHTTPDLVKAQLAMPVVTLGLMMPDQPDAADQVTAFLNSPHSLTITADPPQKVTIGQLGTVPMAERARMLGLRIAGK
jgi:hypothetical protein